VLEGGRGEGRVGLEMRMKGKMRKRKGRGGRLTAAKVTVDMAATRARSLVPNNMIALEGKCKGLIALCFGSDDICRSSLAAL